MAGKTKFADKLLAGLLTLLGFGMQGCDGGGFRAEYGTPTADYVVRGIARSAESEAALSDVRVRVLFRDAKGEYFDYTWDENSHLVTRTGTNGDFELKWQEWASQNALEFFDEEKIATDTLDISFAGLEFVGGERWYRGKATLEVGDVYLDPPQEPEEEPGEE